MTAKDVSVKRKIGCWVHERWKVELVLQYPQFAQSKGISWLDWCNRVEIIEPDLISGGRICNWSDSSRLSVVQSFPKIGIKMMNHVLRTWPISLNFDMKPDSGEQPQVSFLIVIGGLNRLPQFEMALASVRAQVGVAYEVVVVEQSEKTLLAEHLPPDVRYFHQTLRAEEKGFNKSWATNRAAREAKGEILIFLDADYLIPTAFAAECCRVLQNVEGVRPSRLIFYLNQSSTEQLIKDQDLNNILDLDYVVANNPTPVAVKASTYWEVGGHDESFSGWGGEDTEFLNRLRTRRISEGGWMPLLHLWHAAAAKRENGDRNQALYEALISQSAPERISRLLKLNLGGHVPSSASAQFVES